uniref:Uncharacterized protein n=1 Tax=Fagus sylvatica TaxID=28930 RepID=A0A2N9H9W7_FAGSY
MLFIAKTAKLALRTSHGCKLGSGIFALISKIHSVTKIVAKDKTDALKFEALKLGVLKFGDLPPLPLEKVFLPPLPRFITFLDLLKFQLEIEHICSSSAGKPFFKLVPNFLGGAQTYYHSKYW